MATINKPKETKMAVAPKKPVKENTRRVSLSRLIESELDKAELILAAKAIPDKLQDMAEKLATIEADDMMPLLDQLKSSFGPQASERFSQAVIGKVRELLDEVRSAKDAIDTEISNLESVANGGAVPTDMTDAMGGGDAAMGDDMGMDAAMPPAPPAPPAAGAAPDAGMPSDDDIAGADGGASPLGAEDGAAGRARKESATIRGRQIESAVKKLKESKNPDAVVLAEFRTNLTRHSVKEAAIRTAKTFRIDLSDVIDVVMEAKKKDSKKNPFGKKCPPFQRKDAAPADDKKKKVEEGSPLKKKVADTDPCWDGYKMAGTKKKGDKEVPNCVKETTTKKASALKTGDVIVRGKSTAKINRVTHGSRDGRTKVYTGDGGTASSEYDNNENVVVEARNKKSPFKEAEHAPTSSRYRAKLDPVTMHFDIVDWDGKIVRKDASANRDRATKRAASYPNKPIDEKKLSEAVPQGGQTPSMMRAKQTNQPLQQSGKPTPNANQVADGGDDEAPEMPGTTLTGPAGNPPKMPQPGQAPQQQQGAPKPTQANAAPLNKNAAAANQGQTGAQNAAPPTSANPSGSPLGNQSNVEQEQDEGEIPANGQKQMVQAGEEGPKDTQPEDGKNVEPATEKPGFKATSPKGVTMMSTTLPVPPPKHSLMGSGMASPKPTSPTSESRMLQKFIKVVEDHDMSMEPMMAPFFPSHPQEIEEFAEPEIDAPEAHDRIMGYVIRDNRGHMHGCKWIHDPHVPGMGTDEGKPKLYHDRKEAADLADKWTREEGEHDGVMLDNISFGVGALYSNGQYKFPA